MEIDKETFNFFSKADHIYVRRLETGLGDRLGVLLGAITISKLFSKTLYYEWANSYNIAQATNDGRYYPYDIINECVTWPSNFILKNNKVLDNSLITLKHENGGRFPCAAAYDCIPDLIPFTFDNFTLPECLIPFFLKTYYQVCSEFDIKIGETLKIPYFVLHIRGGDKREDNNIDFTCQVVNLISNHMKMPVVVITDDEYLQKKFVISNIMSINYSMCKNQVHTDLYDLKLLMNAKCIIQYSPLGWSAYSNIASLLRKVPLLNTYPGSFNRIEDFRNKGSHIHFWFKHDELQMFLQSLQV